MSTCGDRRRGFSVGSFFVLCACSSLATGWFVGFVQRSLRGSGSFASGSVASGFVGAEILYRLRR